MKQALETRKADKPINQLILGRWSPRAMTGEAIDQETLETVLEAARWAPSAYNEQPWRFIYAHRDSPEWEALNNLLVEFNQEWCKNAAALVLICSTKTFKRNDKPSPTHSFDTGAAWMSLALQGASMGLVVHGMSGFDFDKARADLNIPENVQVEAMCAIGVLADKTTLEGKLLEMESPSDRLPLSETLMHGTYRA